MPLNGTYTGLQASVSDFLNRTDLSATVPDFITLAEAQISRRLVENGPVRAMMGRSDATIDNEFVTVPSDFMGARAIYLTDNWTNSLQFAEPDKINQLKGQYPLGYTGNGNGPSIFSVVGTEFQFWPWNPGDSLPAELTYWKRLPPLATNGTNWLLMTHPDAYLYGALLQSAPYLKDDDRVSVWSTFFETILSDIVATDKVERYAPNMAVPLVIGSTP